MSHIEGSFVISGVKSFYALLFLSLGYAKTAPGKAFLGAHAVSGIVAILGHHFISQKSDYLEKQWLKELNIRTASKFQIKNNTLREYYLQKTI